MAMIVVQVLGLLVFLGITLWGGSALRGRQDPVFAERVSRVSHLAFWLGLITPWVAGLLWPGPAALDAVFGFGSFPLPLPMRLAFGLPLVAMGVVVMQLSISALRRTGHGAPAFDLTDSVVSSGVYARSRNPMALGFYVGLLGGALAAGSSWMLLYTFLGIVPLHLWNLSYFEQAELAIRYGESYEQYRRATPFLLPRLNSPRQ